MPLLCLGRAGIAGSCHTCSAFTLVLGLWHLSSPLCAKCFIQRHLASLLPPVICIYRCSFASLLTLLSKMWLSLRILWGFVFFSNFPGLRSYLWDRILICCPGRSSVHNQDRCTTLPHQHGFRYEGLGWQSPDLMSWILDASAFCLIGSSSLKWLELIYSSVRFALLISNKESKQQTEEFP